MLKFDKKVSFFDKNYPFFVKILSLKIDKNLGHFLPQKWGHFGAIFGVKNNLNFKILGVNFQKMVNLEKND